MLKIFKMAILSKAFLAPTLLYICAFTTLRWSRRRRSVAEVGGGRRRSPEEVGSGGRKRRTVVEVGGGRCARQNFLISKLVMV